MVRSILTSVCLLMVLFGAAGPALAVNIWVNNAANGNWADGVNNWTDGVTPATTDAWLISPTVGTAVISGGSAETVAAYMVVGQGQSGTTDLEIRDTSSLNVAGGPIYMGNGSNIDAVGEIRLRDSASLTVNGFIDMGQFPNCKNNVYASGSSSLNVPGGLFVGNNVGTIGVLDLSGNSVTSTGSVIVGQQGYATLDVSENAVLNVASNLNIGNYIAASTGIANISGGTITSDTFLVGGLGSGTLNMSAGVINVAGEFSVAGGDNFGHVQLDGGTITAAELVLNTVGTMQITGDGMMILEGADWTIEMEDYLFSGQLDATVRFDGANTVLTAVPEPASLMLLSLGGFLIRRKKA